MTIEKMFEVATRNKMRFPFKGLVSVEDLWDLSPQSLDVVYKTLNSELKKSQVESLLNTKTKEDKELETKIEIVKYIVKVKLEEDNNRLKAKEQKEKKQKIMGLLSTKQDGILHNKSIDELKAILENLNK